MGRFGRRIIARGGGALAAPVRSDSAIHAALRLYRAKAMAEIDQPRPASAWASTSSPCVSIGWGSSAAGFVTVSIGWGPAPCLDGPVVRSRSRCSGLGRFSDQVWGVSGDRQQSGRFVRVARALYRLRDYPSSPREELLAAWLRLAPEAVVSDESALELLGLSDIIPNLIHLSVPRTRRKLSRRSGVALHTTTRPLDGSDVVVRDGMRLTGPARTIVDVAETGVAPEQVVRAAQQAIDRGMTTPSRLREAALGRGRRVERLIEIALARKDT